MKRFLVWVFLIFCAGFAFAQWTSDANIETYYVDGNDVTSQYQYGYVQMGMDNDNLLGWIIYLYKKGSATPDETIVIDDWEDDDENGIEIYNTVEILGRNIRGNDIWAAVADEGYGGYKPGYIAVGIYNGDNEEALLYVTLEYVDAGY
ncbi:MAG: hypothetical protein LBQ88_11890 [Treponema sp.]|nr:hypothetical protein [Treponema sp.]